MQNVKILIKNLLDELVDKNEFLIVDIECKPYRQRVEIRVFADKKKGRITLDECAKINKSMIVLTY